MGGPIKIALVDDHTLLRDALASVIDKMDDHQVILLASHGKEFIEKLARGYLPDVVILDINMPELDGYDTAKWIGGHHPAVRVLVLTMYDSEFMMIRLLRLGVRGFLKKDIHPSELRQAIGQVMTSGYYYSGDTAGKLLNRLKNGESGSALASTLDLTDTEVLFLQLASTEMTYKEIAMEMKIRPRTVDYHRDTLFVKLNVKSRVGLVLYAITSGITRVGFDRPKK
jgi:two-component system invasion response regulator UvrY